MNVWVSYLASWGSAFRGAIATLLWSIAWFMIGLGIIVAAALFGGMRFVKESNGGLLLQSDPWIMIPAFVIGVFIIGLGWMTAFYRIQHGIIKELTGGASGLDIEGSSNLACPSCGGENLPRSKYCIHCGIQLN